MKKFFEGMLWSTIVLAGFIALVTAIVFTALGFIYVFGDWGAAIFGVLFLIVGGGIIHATGDDR